MSKQQTTQETTQVSDQTTQETTQPPQATAADDWSGWCRVSDLCDRLGVSGRTGSRWAVRTDDPELCRKRPRASGGSPEWWASPNGAEALKAAVVTPDDTPSSNGSMSSVAPVTPDDAADNAVVEAMRLAVDEARARAANAEAERDRLRSDLTEERDRLRRELQLEGERRARAERQAEEAERARTAYAQTLADERAAWWQWVSYLKGLSLLRRLRRLPDPPENLTKATKRLAAPKPKEG